MVFWTSSWSSSAPWGWSGPGSPLSTRRRRYLDRSTKRFFRWPTEDSALQASLAKIGISWSRRFYQNFCLCLLDFDWNLSLRSWSRRQMRLTCSSWVLRSQANAFYVHQPDHHQHHHHQPHHHQHHLIFFTIITSSLNVILHPLIHLCLHSLSTGLGLFHCTYRQVDDPEADAYNPQGRLWLGRKDHVQADCLRQHNPQVSPGSPTHFEKKWSIQLV